MTPTGRLVPVRPTTPILTKPGCRHRAIGQLKIDNITVTPEPATMALRALGGIAVLARRRRRTMA